MRYTALLVPEVMGFTAMVPALPGCHTQGDTVLGRAVSSTGAKPKAARSATRRPATRSAPHYGQTLRAASPRDKS